jgi:hypothetical protein
MNDIPDDVIDEIYLPFTPDVLSQHFAEVAGNADPARHLTYYLTSKVNRASFLAGEVAGTTSKDLRVVRRGQQIEKDERFWVVAALMRMFHDTPDRTVAFAEVLRRCQGLQLPIGGFGTWEEALGGELHLYFEANLPSPAVYREYLRDNLINRTLPIPNLRRAGAARGARLEGATKVDALLIAPETGFSVLFEAKVLADMSCGIEFDVLRNQMIRNIDVMLDTNAALRHPLNLRDPERTCFVLLTPNVFRANREGRLYGWLFDAYKDRPELLRKHLPYRDEILLSTVPSRLGWLTWEDLNEVKSDACPWLDE